MSNINWLTASGQELSRAYLSSKYTSLYEFAIEVIIPSVSRAVEAKVRGECATERDQWKRRAETAEAWKQDAERQLIDAGKALAGANLAAKSHYERAECLASELTDVRAKFAQEVVGTEMLRGQLADAKREGAYEALVELAGKQSEDFDRDWCLTMAKRYAPSPAPLMLGGWSVTYTLSKSHNVMCYLATEPWHDFEMHEHVHDLLAAIKYSPTPTEYAALCQLKENASNALLPEEASR